MKPLDRILVALATLTVVVWMPLIVRFFSK
jgi:hypothetical protein